MSYVSKLKQLMTLTLLVLIISGCQGLPLPGITAVAPITNVGDEAETITNVNNAPDLFWQIMLVVGWMAPSPSEIFKGVGNFILKLFGRDK